MKKIELNVSRVIYGLLGVTLTFDVLLSLSQYTLYENLSSVLLLVAPILIMVYIISTQSGRKARGKQRFCFNALSNFCPRNRCCDWTRFKSNTALQCFSGNCIYRSYKNFSRKEVDNGVDHFEKMELWSFRILSYPCAHFWFLYGKSNSN